MTHIQNRPYKSTPFFCAGFWYVCHSYMAPGWSGARFRCRLEHCSIPSQKVACMWPKWWLTIGQW